MVKVCIWEIRALNLRNLEESSLEAVRNLGMRPGAWRDRKMRPGARPERVTLLGGRRRQERHLEASRFGDERLLGVNQKDQRDEDRQSWKNRHNSSRGRAQYVFGHFDWEVRPSFLQPLRSFQAFRGR